MARSGSSHTCELLGGHDGVRSHHGLFNEGPFGRWPADDLVPLEKREYYSSILDETYARIGGEEHSGEFLERYIFTDDPRYNPHGWDCVGFKIQFVHFVHMPDLRDYLLAREDVKIVLNTRRHLLEHVCAESWCQNGNARAARAGEAYHFGTAQPVAADPSDVLGTFRNLCRYRRFALELFDDGRRDFLEWSYEDMFHADGSLNVESHLALFDFLEIRPSRQLETPFARTPRPDTEEYFTNYDELERFFTGADEGIFAKYFAPTYDPRADRSWPLLRDYWLDEVMVENDNDRFRT